jgi:cytochrome c oxidase assembly protein subunit 15
MTLDEFKEIYYWEWSHRFLGRFIGAAFLLPFLFFLWRGWIAEGLRWRLWLIFGLGAVQGAVGWWMVASGLADRTEVSQYRLATHLVLAVGIYAAIVWTLRRVRGLPELAVAVRHRVTGGILVAAIFVQFYFGALVAGLRAGRTFNTWPLIDGALIPDAARLFFVQPWWRNLFENTLTVQFNHRMLAYALWLAALWHLVDAVRSRAATPVVNGALFLLILMTVQAALGILTLLHMVPIGLALIHQATALVVLTAALWHSARMAPRPAIAGIPSPAVA